MSYEVAQPHFGKINGCLKKARSAPNEAVKRSGAFFVAYCYTNVVYYVYILKLRDNTYYHGFSDDLKGRMKTHRGGVVSSTKNFRPLELVFYAAFSSKKKALDFEAYLKTQSGFAFRNKRLVEK